MATLLQGKREKEREREPAPRDVKGKFITIQLLLLRYFLLCAAPFQLAAFAFFLFAFSPKLSGALSDYLEFNLRKAFADSSHFPQAETSAPIAKYSWTMYTVAAAIEKKFQLKTARTNGMKIPK